MGERGTACKDLCPNCFTSVCLSVCGNWRKAHERVQVCECVCTSLCAQRRFPHIRPTCECTRECAWVSSYLSCKSDFVFLNGISSQHLELGAGCLPLPPCCCGGRLRSGVHLGPKQRGQTRHWVLRLQRTCKKLHKHTHANTHSDFFQRVLSIFSPLCHFSFTPSTDF